MTRIARGSPEDHRRDARDLAVLALLEGGAIRAEAQRQTGTTPRQFRELLEECGGWEREGTAAPQGGMEDWHSDISASPTLTSRRGHSRVRSVALRGKRK